MGWIYSEHRHTGHCQGFFSAYIILTCVHIDTWRQSVYSQAEACTWFCWERNFHPQVFFFFWCCHYTVIQQSVHESFSDSRFATSSYISENLEAVDHNRQLFFHFKHLFRSWYWRQFSFTGLSEQFNTTVASTSEDISMKLDLCQVLISTFKYLCNSGKQ